MCAPARYSRKQALKVRIRPLQSVFKGHLELPPSNFVARMGQRCLDHLAADRTLRGYRQHTTLTLEVGAAHDARQLGKRGGCWPDRSTLFAMYATTELSKQVYCTVSAGFARFRWLASARGTHNETTRTAHRTDTRIGGVFYDSPSRARSPVRGQSLMNREDRIRVSMPAYKALHRPRASLNAACRCCS